MAEIKVQIRDEKSLGNDRLPPPTVLAKDASSSFPRVTPTPWTHLSVLGISFLAPIQRSPAKIVSEYLLIEAETLAPHRRRVTLR